MLSRDPSICGLCNRDVQAALKGTGFRVLGFRGGGRRARRVRCCGRAGRGRGRGRDGARGRECSGAAGGGTAAGALILLAPPKTLARPVGAGPELLRTPAPSGDPNSMPWKAVRPRGTAFRIPRVSEGPGPPPPERPPCVQGSLHPGPRTPGAHGLSSPGPSSGGAQGLPGSRHGPARRPLEELGGLLVSDLNTVGWGEGKEWKKRGGDGQTTQQKAGTLQQRSWSDWHFPIHLV